MPPTDGRSGPTRATPLALLVIAGVLLAARVAVGVWDEASPDARPELVTWNTPAGAESVARDRGRLMLYAFTDQRQKASRDLSREVFSNANLARSLDKDFVPVRIEGSAEQDPPDAHDLRARFHVTELPALVVATPDGAHAKLVSGFHDARTTMTALKEAQLQVMGLPFTHGGGFQFRFGRHDSLGRGPFERGGAGDKPDGERANGDSTSPR